MAEDVPVIAGNYKVYLCYSDEGNFGIRVSAIIVCHEDYFFSLNEKWELRPEDIGVDSGQCGIFDDLIYPQLGDETGKYDDLNSFYGECCYLT